MLAKPQQLIDREIEWRALDRFIARRHRLALVYGPRRVGKSYLLEAICDAIGGNLYQAFTSTTAAQLDDFGRVVGSWLGVGPLRLQGWADALDRLALVDSPLVVLDELPYLTESGPELTSLLQRYVDRRQGPPLALAGSSLSTMASLLEPRAPLYGRAGAVVVPRPFAGRDLADLWQVTDPMQALWVDAAVGGLPGYRPALKSPRAALDEWMVEEVLAPSSPLLDAAEATLGEVPDVTRRGLYRTILIAIASGDRTFTAIAGRAGQPTGALTRPLVALERAGLVSRVGDPLRSRRDTYDLADPHLRTWLSIILPNRSDLLAGLGQEVWERVRDTTWRAQVLGPRWEAVARAHLARTAASLLGPTDVVGTTIVADRTARTNHEVDMVALRTNRVIAVGEAKLRQLKLADLDRLRRTRDLLGAPDARIVLASVSGIDHEVARAKEVITVVPRDVYG